jgi:sugar transferase (PEP-CTERM/EpsH1 system associated)
MRVLFLTHRLPYAPNRGDRIRAFHLLRALTSRFEVELLSLVHDREEEGHAEDMRRRGLHVTAVRVPRLRNLMRAAAALPTSRPLTHVLLDTPGLTATLGRIIERSPPDVVLAYCSGMARLALEPPLEGLPFVLDMVDVDSRKWASLARSTMSPKKLIFAREARYLARFEARATHEAVATLVVNEREQAALGQLAPGERIIVLPNGVDVESARPHHPPVEEPCLIFCGVMNYAPNEQAVRWFVRSVWPRVIAGQPRARLLIVGAKPTRGVRALGTPDSSILVTGSVPDVVPYLSQAAVSIAPIFTSHGVQTKVLEAIVSGLPCVVTPAVMDGLPDDVRSACAAAATPEDFASEVLRLLALTGSERRRIALASGIARLDWGSIAGPLLNILADAVRQPAAGS